MILAACTSAPAARDGDIVISGQGFFASGGTVTEPVPGTYNPATNWLDPDRPGNTAHVDHANTFFQIPSGGTGAPMVFLHGYGQSRNGWLSSPDGGEAWAAWFLRQGHPVFLVDQPRRASAGNTVRMTDMELDAWGDDMKDYKPGDQAWYTHFRIGRVAPERYEGSQFPAGAEAQNQFFRQMTPNTGNYDEALFGSVLGDVMEDVSEMTGKKAVYVTHSQGSRVGWKTPVENIAAIVAVEPGGAPEAGSAEYRALLAADIPVMNSGGTSATERSPLPKPTTVTAGTRRSSTFRKSESPGTATSSSRKKTTPKLPPILRRGLRSAVWIDGRNAGTHRFFTLLLFSIHCCNIIVTA